VRLGVAPNRARRRKLTSRDAGRIHTERVVACAYAVCVGAVALGEVSRRTTPDPLDALDPMGTGAFAEDPRRCAAPRGRRRRGIRRDPRRRTDEGRRCRAGSRRGSLPLGQAVRPARLEKNPRAEALAQGHPHHVRTVLRAHLAAVQRVADRVLLRRVRSRVASREALLHRQRFDHERERGSRGESRGGQVRAAQGSLSFTRSCW
jgi:hypothetical protein